MEAKPRTLLLFLVLLFSLVISFQSPVAAHPVSSLSPAKELASMEALLQRLEEKVSLMEDLQDGPGFEEPSIPRRDLNEALEEEQEEEEEEGNTDFRAHHPRFASSPGRSSLLKRMMGLQAPKSLRESGCFGRRMDRIGSVSGLGCKGEHRAVMGPKAGGISLADAPPEDYKAQRGQDWKELDGANLGKALPPSPTAPEGIPRSNFAVRREGQELGISSELAATARMPIPTH
ncbi:natriuretic peptides A-like [Anolis sagrei]|uniref:natriuretic peptides A-like n=1 Tax=Anolis sagrei TaxID=38937 RepID=UPI0035207F1F